MTKGRSGRLTRSKWYLPSFSLVLGLVMLAASWLGGHPVQGVVSLAVLAVFGLAIHDRLLAVAGLAYVLAVGWFRWRG